MKRIVSKQPSGRFFFAVTRPKIWILGAEEKKKNYGDSYLLLYATA